MDKLPNAVSLIKDNEDKIDVERFRVRIEDTTKAFNKFLAGEIEDVQGSGNLEIPLTLAAGLTFMNFIPMRLGLNDNSDDFAAVVKQALLEAVSEDFDICYEMSKTNKDSIKNDE